MISIIIPTLNEEKYLPRLLESIKNQDYPGEIEIIVADARSKDKTREIAQSFGCRVVEGGLLSLGRNEGAKVARGELLLFSDSDVVLPKDFLTKAVKAFRDHNLGAACFTIYPFGGSRLQKLLFNLFFNYPTRVVTKIITPLGSVVFLVKKDVHKSINGFDELCVFQEDFEYLKRLRKKAKYKILKDIHFHVSVRRFDNDGWASSFLKGVGGVFYLVFIGSIRTDIFKYKFGHHDLDS